MEAIEYGNILGPLVDYHDVQDPVCVFHNDILIGRFVYNEGHIFNKKNFIFWGRQPDFLYNGDIKDGRCFLTYLHEKITCPNTVKEFDITTEYQLHEKRYINLREVDE